MSWEFSENILLQESAGRVLQEKLGWEVVFAYNTEKLGLDGTLGRVSYHEILLLRYLKAALFANNDWMTDDYAEKAIKHLLTVSAAAALIQTNEEKYQMLRDGIPVEYRKTNGQREIRYAQIFNFAEPEKNHFLAVKEMKIHGELYHRRTDIVGFVNGIPLLFVELKRQDVDVENAYNLNYTDYQQTIPQIFHYNAFVMLSNGLEAKVGTLGSKYGFFHEWKRLKEEDTGSVDLETMLLGICNKKNFMDLFENFILFDKSGGHTTKILARNHQYLGVNEAVESYTQRKLKEGKLGVFWHTQGSGKSYSMVFFARKIRRKFEGTPTIVVLTDRDELNKQISDTFEACGCLGSVKASKFMPENGAKLIEMLKGNPSFIFTLIQKFNQSEPEPIVPDHDILILSDEAHRTQNGIFADNMCRLLPTAARIGFTGTPLFKYDNITERTFGSYVSIYDFKRAVDDGATVPLYYENRSDLLGIQNPELNEELLEAVEAADLDADQKAKLELELRNDVHILTAEPRLKAIARDFVDHYSDLWTTGKAMFVCVNKVTCVRMFHFVQEFWKEKIAALEKEQKHLDSQQEFQEMERKLNWMRETEMAVVVSQEQNEILHFKNWGLDILPHREKMEKRELDKEFKDADNPFRIVFVCAMWLTGFDVKSLSNIYLDKPLKAHTLMQTIARANRVCDGKSNGLIIDYIGVVKALRQALASYTTRPDGSKDDPTPDKEQLLQRIREIIASIEQYLAEHNFRLDDILEHRDFEKLKFVKQGAEAVCAPLEVRKAFEIQARELFRCVKFAGAKDLLPEEKRKKNAINEIYNQLQKKRKDADNSALMAQVNEIVSSHVEVLPGETEFDARKFDISNIDFDRLQQEFTKKQNKQLVIKDLQDVIEERLAAMMKTNPLRNTYYEQYQSIIEAYNKENKKEEILVVFENLIKLVQSLDDEQKRYVREGFENDEELAIYDLLMKDTLSAGEIKKVKELAKTLLKTIKAKIHELDHWRDKESTKADISISIRDILYEKLPDSYDDLSIASYQQKIYEYVYSTYPAA